MNYSTSKMDSTATNLSHVDPDQRRTSLNPQDVHCRRGIDAELLQIFTIEGNEEVKIRNKASFV